MDIQALQAAKAEIESKLEEAKKAAKAGTVKQILDLMTEAGLTGADLGFTPPAKASRPKRAKSTREPKYRDPESGQAWVGRGKRPTWLVQALAGGRSLESFAAQ
jgi:DNA-binding protein H-NS